MSSLSAATLTAAVSAPSAVRTKAQGQQRLIAEFPSYIAAEELVDRLSDKGFPVQRARIIGTDLRSVDDVTGRLSTRGAAVAGAVAGAWLGLLFGLLLGMFSTDSQWLGLLVGSSLAGALWLGVFGFVAHHVNLRRREFSSTRRMEAGSYAVYIDSAYAYTALRLGGLT